MPRSYTRTFFFGFCAVVRFVPLPVGTLVMSWPEAAASNLAMPFFVALIVPALLLGLAFDLFIFES